MANEKVWTPEQNDRAADEWQNRVFSAIDEDTEDGLRPEALAGCQQAGEGLCRELAEAVELLLNAQPQGVSRGRHDSTWFDRRDAFIKRNTGGNDAKQPAI